MNWKTLLVVASLTLSAGLTSCSQQATTPDATKTETKTETTTTPAADTTKPADGMKSDTTKPADATKPADGMKSDTTKPADGAKSETKTTETKTTETKPAETKKPQQLARLRSFLVNRSNLNKSIAINIISDSSRAGDVDGIVVGAGSGERGVMSKENPIQGGVPLEGV